MKINPHAPSNRHSNCYRKHEQEKKRQYEQRVREVEHASFTPLVLSASGGMENQATIFYKRLASSLALKCMGSTIQLDLEPPLSYQGPALEGGLLNIANKEHCFKVRVLCFLMNIHEFFMIFIFPFAGPRK